jgi:hypothetical protein
MVPRSEPPSVMVMLDVVSPLKTWYCAGPEVGLAEPVPVVCSSEVA